MEYLIIIIILVLTIIILKVGLNIKIKDIKEVRAIGLSKENNNIIEKFPENKQICEEILQMIENTTVTVEETSNNKSQTSLYLVMQNKILIANINNTFTRIQTIAHECIHSIQNKTVLKFNFILSNINILYFIIISILAICNVFNNNINNILLIILILMQFILFAIRGFLENDAMTRAEYLSEKYINKKQLINKKDAEFIIKEDKKLNKIGIKLYDFILICKNLMKPILYCILLSIF